MEAVREVPKGTLFCFCRRYEDEQEEAMEEAYQDYLFRQGQRTKAAELKNAKEPKPGDLFKDAIAEVEPCLYWN